MHTDCSGPFHPVPFSIEINELALISSPANTLPQIKFNGLHIIDSISLFHTSKDEQTGSD